MAVEPIKPSEIALAKLKAIPDVVFQAFNELIAEKYDNKRAIVKQDNVVLRIIVLASDAGLDYDKSMIFDRGWLNVEDVYRAAGWKVVYDKPGYNESYDAFFEFKHP